jgi:hypothetical protein
MADENRIALYKDMFSNEIKITYLNDGTLKNLIRNESDVRGKLLRVPLMGRKKTYTRIGGEFIQPQSPVTSYVDMEFKTEEATEDLPEIEVDKMFNPNFIPDTVMLLRNALTTTVEQDIMDSFDAIPVTDSSSINVDNIDNGYRINGDGSAYTNTAGEKVLDFDGLLSIRQMFDDMGIAKESRFLYIPANALKGLMRDDKFINQNYSATKNITVPGSMYNDVFNFNIVVAQKNPNGGLKSSGAGTYAYAFTRDTMQINSAGLNAKTWFSDERQSHMFLANIKYGIACVKPSSFIKVACKTVI